MSNIIDFNAKARGKIIPPKLQEDIGYILGVMESFGVGASPAERALLAARCYAGFRRQDLYEELQEVASELIFAGRLARAVAWALGALDDGEEVSRDFLETAMGYLGPVRSRLPSQAQLAKVPPEDRGPLLSLFLQEIYEETAYWQAHLETYPYAKEVLYNLNRRQRRLFRLAMAFGVKPRLRVGAKQRPAA